MEYRNLGQSGLKVSSLCLGTMTFGEADEKSFMHKAGTDDESAFAIANRAVDEGVNFIDTADVYGQDGLAERVIGKWFARDKRRNEVVLATKFRFRMSAGPNGTGASRLRIMQSVEQSLKRLGTDRIDLYQIHMQDVETPEEETLRALDDLVRQGKVLYIGASNYTGYRLVDSLWTSRHEHLERFVSLQVQYSLAVRDIEFEIVPPCKKFGVGILAWSPLAAGFLSGKYEKNSHAPEGSRFDATNWRARYAQFDTDRNWRIVDHLKRTALELGVTPSQVALAWLLRKPFVSSVVFGARTMLQLEENLAAAKLPLPDTTMQSLDNVSEMSLPYPYAFMKNIQGRW